MSLPKMMALWCPTCGTRHVDQGEWRDKPHHKHLCASCGHIWDACTEQTALRIGDKLLHSPTRGASDAEIIATGRAALRGAIVTIGALRDGGKTHDSHVAELTDVEQLLWALENHAGSRCTCHTTVPEMCPEHADMRFIDTIRTHLASCLEVIRDPDTPEARRTYIQQSYDLNYARVDVALATYRKARGL